MTTTMTKTLRRSTLLLLLLVGSLAAKADSIPPAPVPADLSALMEEGAKAYGAEAYDRAITLYSKALEKTEEPSAELYYNLACAHYKAGNLSQAILNFERAYRQDPSDADIRYNLDFLYSRTAERIEQPRSRFFSGWLDGLTHGLSLGGWMTLALVAFALFLGLGLLFLLASSPQWRRGGFYGALVALVFCVVFNLFVYRSHHFISDRSAAVLTAPIVTIESSPDASAKDIAVVHEGHRVTLLDRVGSYSKIRLADGTEGWIPDDSYEVIYP